MILFLCSLFCISINPATLERLQEIGNITAIYVCWSLSSCTFPLLYHAKQKGKYVKYTSQGSKSTHLPCLARVAKSTRKRTPSMFLNGCIRMAVIHNSSVTLHVVLNFTGSSLISTLYISRTSAIRPEVLPRLALEQPTVYQGARNDKGLLRCITPKD